MHGAVVNCLLCRARQINVLYALMNVLHESVFCSVENLKVPQLAVRLSRLFGLIIEIPPFLTCVCMHAWVPCLLSSDLGKTPTHARYILWCWPFCLVLLPAFTPVSGRGFGVWESPECQPVPGRWYHLVWLSSHLHMQTSLSAADACWDASSWCTVL